MKPLSKLMQLACLSALLVAPGLAGAATVSGATFNKDVALNTVRELSKDAMAGRLTGTPGSEMAQAFLRGRIEALGVQPVGDGFAHTFSFTREIEGEQRNFTGTNYLFHIEGTGSSNQALVITAHYDHVGTRGDAIYNGADDNASGVAGLFAVAESFLAAPPQHDIVFALLDAEELGLSGARALLDSGLLAGFDIALNMNFDMLSQNDRNELYVAGAYHRPALVPIIERIAAAAPVSLKMGHDDPALGPQDWTFQSDHGVFHQAGVPFVYFGVEDHPHYHQPSDTFDTIPTDFFLRSLETVVIAARLLDQSLGDISG